MSGSSASLRGATISAARKYAGAMCSERNYGAKRMSRRLARWGTWHMFSFLKIEWSRPQAFAWLLAAFVFAELSWRILSGVFVLSIDNLVARELSPLQWANGPLIYDDKLGWRLKPRFQAPGQGRPDGKLSAGALGLRGGPYAGSRVPTRAILAVGESQTLGINVDDSETWPARLSELLQETVLNGSAWSWGLDQIVLRTEELVP